MSYALVVCSLECDVKPMLVESHLCRVDQCLFFGKFHSNHSSIDRECLLPDMRGVVLGLIPLYLKIPLPVCIVRNTDLIVSYVGHDAKPIERSACVLLFRYSL